MHIFVRITVLDVNLNKFVVNRFPNVAPVNQKYFFNCFPHAEMFQIPSRVKECLSTGFRFDIGSTDHLQIATTNYYKCSTEPHALIIIVTTNHTKVLSSPESSCDRQ
jgi:hypothetical protein